MPSTWKVPFVQTKEFVLTSEGGISLKGYQWLPVAKPKAVLQIVHGMAEHGARYERVASRLVSHGFAVVTHDHRGHGRSVASGQLRGHMADRSGWKLAVHDVHRVNQWIRREVNWGGCVIVLGHSMGSFMVQQLLGEFPDDADAACLSGSNDRPALIKVASLVARADRARLGRRHMSPLLAKLAFGNNNRDFMPARTENDWLSRDAVEVDKYETDPACGHDMTTQFWVDFFDGLSRLGDFHKSTPRGLPLYLFAGSEDPVGERGTGVIRLLQSYRRAGLSDLRLTLYPGARHETLNETNREQVETDLLEFCQRAAAT